ncbi:MAG: DUF1684 domain-containing protein [Chloroflexota bacterium]
MTQLTEYRAMKDAMFRSNQSPLPPAERRTFSGLKYFAENPSLRIETRLQPYARPERVQMATSTGHIAEFLKYGHVAFEVDGKTQTLQIYKSEDQDELFLPFMDATTGHETYGSGRYLDAHAKADGTIVLDFNLAYNPYCAYAAHWSCPVPPTENRLSMRIDAGEQTYQ